jgi:pimeloyl-ACP methyl ester carboxylesterase
MLSAVGIIASAAPWVAGTREVPMSAWLTHLAATYWPAGLRFVTGALVGMLRWIMTTGPVTRWIDAWLDGLKHAKELKQEKEGMRADEEVTLMNSVPLVEKMRTAEGGSTPEEEPTTAERRERVIRMGFEGFAQGPGGFVQEAQLLTQDWGFRFEDVIYDPIQIWHGVEDKNAPVRMIRYMADRLPHSDLQEFQGEGHFAVANHLEEILAELVPEEPLTEYSTNK